MTLHAGLIALHTPRGWRGALILGPSGAGKSDLALRAMEDGFRLVADDRTAVFVSGGVLFGKPPQALAGLLEIRGLGVVRQDALAYAPVCLAVRCKMSPAEVDRLPEPAVERIKGVDLPALDLWALENSATAKIRRAIEILGTRA